MHARKQVHTASKELQIDAFTQSNEEELLSFRCSIEADCADSSLVHGWIPMPSTISAHRCPRLVRPLQPSNASLYAPMSLEIVLELNALPSPGTDGLYQCVFGDTDYIPASFEEPRTLRCHLPPYKVRPNVEAGEGAVHSPSSVRTICSPSVNCLDSFLDHVVTPLKLWSSRSSQIFHEERFIFYDCEAHNL